MLMVKKTQHPVMYSTQRKLPLKKLFLTLTKIIIDLDFIGQIPMLFPELAQLEPSDLRRKNKTHNF